MILERAELVAREGQEDAFAAVLFDQGKALLASGEGCRSVQVGRGVENPNKFILLIEWDSVDAHNAHRETATHETFSGLIRPFVGGGAMEHFDVA